MVSSLVLSKKQGGLICSSLKFILFKINQKNNNQADVIKVIENHNFINGKHLAFYTGSVALEKANSFLVHDNAGRKLQRIYKNKLGEYVCESVIANLKSVSILTSSLKKNDDETLLFLNQKEHIRVVNIESFPKVSSFNIGWNPHSEISDFEILSNNVVLTLSFDGFLNIYKISAYKHESRLVHTFKIQGESSEIDGE